MNPSLTQCYKFCFDNFCLISAHGVGGFSQSFSSLDICRFCHCQYKDLQDNIHSYGSKQHGKWTEEEYDQAALQVENSRENDSTTNRGYYDDSSSSEDIGTSGDETDVENDSEDETNVELYGVKHRCPLNSLQAFHCTSGFPPDILHDIFEGVVSQDLLGIIRILKVKGWFTIAEYNSNLKVLKYKSNEASDKPESVPESMKVKKLIGKAVSNWTHLRNFPLLIRKFIKDKDEPALALGLQLHEIVERITANEFRMFEVNVLEERIIEFLDYRQKLFTDYPALLGNPKPKTRNLTHYPEAIVNYGPPMNYWTARYESRHRIGKSTAEASKNFKNISLTLATRQQLRLSSVYYHGMFDTDELVISDKVMYKKDLGGSTELEKSMMPFVSDDDFICGEVVFRNQVYNKGDLVVMKVFNQDELKVGLVICILVRNNTVFFVVKEFLAKRNWLRFFKGYSENAVMSIIDAKHLGDYKPLNYQGTASHPYFCLHHHVSHSFD